MSNFILKDAFPETPRGFQDRMSLAFDQIREVEPMKNRYKLTTALVAALVAAIALAGLALAAAQSNLLERLFPNAHPSEQAQKLATPVGMSQTIGKASFRVNEYLLDGSDLYINWTAHSDEDEQLILANVLSIASLPALKHNDEYIALGGGEGIALGGMVLGKPANRELNFTTRMHNYGAQMDAPFEVQLTAQLFRPKLPIEENTGLDGRLRGEHLVSTGLNAMPVVQLMNYVNEGEGNWVGYMLDIARASEEVGRFEFSFVVAPDSAHIVHTEVDGQSEFAFDDYVIRFTNVDFTAASTHIEYVLTLKRDIYVMGSAGDEGGWNPLWFQAYVDGKELVLESDRGGGRMEMEGSMWGGPLSRIPDEVTIVPVFFNPWAERAPTPIEGQEMILKLKQVS